MEDKASGVEEFCLLAKPGNNLPDALGAGGPGEIQRKVDMEFQVASGKGWRQVLFSVGQTSRGFKKKQADLINEPLEATAIAGNVFRPDKRRSGNYCSEFRASDRCVISART